MKGHTLFFLAAWSRAVMGNPATIPATALTNRGTNDTAAGSLFVEKASLAGVVGCRLRRWSFYDNDSPGLSLTPLLFERTAANTYILRGIGTSRVSTGSGVQANLSFGLVSGTDMVQNANYFIGWKDGSNGANNTGVIDYDNSGSPGVDWLNAGHTSFAVSEAKAVQLPLARTYSLNGIFTLPNEPPAITEHPESKNVLAGGSVTFRVTATGDGTLTYQWQKGTDDIPNATGPEFTKTNLQVSDSGDYRCEVTGTYGTATSNAATLTVIPPPPVATTGIAINELVAENAGGLQDEDGASPDWIELVSTNAAPLSLAGWRLTDDPANLTKWTFPETPVDPGGFLVVFASSKNRTVPGAPLHTNFRLDNDGEYLALVKPDGTIAQEFAPAFPKLKENTSYGTGVRQDHFDFIAASATARWKVPADASLDSTWVQTAFDDTGWSSGPLALGFDTINTPAGPPVETAGNPIIIRALYDGANGSIFVMENAGFTQSGTVTDWQVWSSVSRQITPLILHRGTSGEFSIKGIGTTRTSSGVATAQSFAFGLAAGSATVGIGDFLGWKDGGNGTDNTGTPVYQDGGGGAVRWFSQVTSFSAGQNLGAGQAFARTYSLAATVKRSIAAQVATSLQTAMLQVNPSVYVRLPFTLESVPALDLLTLRLRYEDGFTAWLNGTLIASRNAPAAPAWNSAATSDRSRDDGMTVEDVDLSAHIGLLQPGANVLAIQGLNSSASSGEFLLQPEFTGTKSTPQPGHFMLTPTPGAANARGYSGFVADTTFSPGRGIFSSAQTVTITTLTPGTVIRYTTDGSEPSETTGQLYSAPLPVTTTTVLRAAAFAPDMVPTNIDTHSYIFPAHVPSQTNAPPGFDPSWPDYEVDPNVPMNASHLTDIPSVSLVTARGNLFGTGGIYTNSGNRGMAWERPASIEFIVPGGTRDDHFQVDCGIRLAGDSSRSHSFTPKHHFLAFFRSEYGPSQLHFDLFPDTAENDFDVLELRACSTDSWPVQNGYVHQGEIRWETHRATYLRDQVMRDTLRDMGQQTSHGRYVHLYLDGLYWGLYNLCERMNNGWAAEHHGGAKDDYDVMKDYGELEDGTIVAWQQLMGEVASLPAGDAAADTLYQKLLGNNPDGTRNPVFPVLLDAANLIDYMAAHIYAGAEDWPNHNWWGSRRRDALSEGWRFHAWDQEISNISLTRTLCIFGQRFEEVNGGNSPAIVYDRLRRSPQFRVRFQRRLEALLFGGGPLTASACAARWNERRAEIDAAITGEAARWGDVRREPPFNRNDWLTEMTRVQNFWSQNHPLAVARFQRVNLYPGDADNDGLPDTWEQRRGLNPAVNDAAQDTDGDGMTNAQEFQADTDPRDGASRFLATPAPPPPGESFALAFTAAEGRSYAVQRSTDLGSWTTLALWHAAPQVRTVNYVPPSTTGDSRVQYRVITPAP
jgi:hypothetical protein